MRHSLEEYNAGRHRAGYPELEIGIGVNSGHLMLGTVGDDERMESTVISHVVNVASRIEGLTKGGDILLSDATLKSCKRSIEYASFGEHTFKGKDKPMSVYALTGLK